MKCPECGSHLVHTSISVVCPQCGLVVDNKPSYTGPSSWSGVPPFDPRRVKGVVTGRGTLHKDGAQTAYHAALLIASVLELPNPSAAARLAAQRYKKKRREGGAKMRAWDVAIAVVFHEAIRAMHVPLPLKKYIKAVSKLFCLSPSAVRRATVKTASSLGIWRPPPSVVDAVKIICHALRIPPPTRTTAIKMAESGVKTGSPWLTAAAILVAIDPRLLPPIISLLDLNRKMVVKTAKKIALMECGHTPR